MCEKAEVREELDNLSILFSKLARKLTDDQMDTMEFRSEINLDKNCELFVSIKTTGRFS